MVGVWGFNTENIDKVMDGTSNTLLVGESTTATNPGHRTFWAYPFAYYSLPAPRRSREYSGATTTLPCRPAAPAAKIPANASGAASIPEP